MIPAIIDEFEADFEEVFYPSYTYRMALDDKRIRGFTDGKDAMAQAIYKRLMTQRGAYPIYSSSYGFDAKDLFGMPTDWVCAVLPDRIKDALMPDDRISDVRDFSFQIPSKNAVLVTFMATTVFGEVKINDLEVIVGV